MKNIRLYFLLFLLGLLFMNLKCSKKEPVSPVKYANINVKELDIVSDSIIVRSDNPIVHIFLSDSNKQSWYPESYLSISQKFLFKTPLECRFIVYMEKANAGTSVFCLIDKDDCISDTGRYCAFWDPLIAKSISTVDSKGVITTSNLIFK